MPVRVLEEGPGYVSTDQQPAVSDYSPRQQTKTNPDYGGQGGVPQKKKNRGAASSQDSAHDKHKLLEEEEKEDGEIEEEEIEDGEVGVVGSVGGGGSGGEGLVLHSGARQKEDELPQQQQQQGEDNGEVAMVAATVAAEGAAATEGSINGDLQPAGETGGALVVTSSAMMEVDAQEGESKDNDEGGGGGDGAGEEGGEGEDGEGEDEDGEVVALPSTLRRRFVPPSPDMLCPIPCGPRKGAMILGLDCEMVGWFGFLFRVLKRNVFVL